MVATSGATRVAGVIGHPVRHSLSPVIHNAAYAALDLDWTFVAFDVDAGSTSAAIEAMRVLGLAGLSVTMPHKAAVLDSVDSVTAEAQEVGAANCIIARGGDLVATNTDGAGFVDSLRVDHGVEVRDRRAVVLGAGGAARAVIAALSRQGAAEVVVVNRTAEHRTSAAAIGGPVVAEGVAEQVAVADLVVNATSVGMGSGPDARGPVPVDVDHLNGAQVVVDLVYDPVDTPLLKAARRAGATAVDGVGMLVHQAARALTLWTDREAPIEAMTAAARNALASAANGGQGEG